MSLLHSTTLSDIHDELRLHRAVLVQLLDGQELGLLRLRGLSISLGNLNQQETRMAKKLAEYVQELQAQHDQEMTAIEAQSTVIGGVEVLIEGQVAQLAGLKTQLDEALAGGGDPSVLQPLIDKAAAAQQVLTLNTARIAAAIVKGTPAEQTPGGGTPVDPTTGATTLNR